MTKNMIRVSKVKSRVKIYKIYKFFVGKKQVSNLRCDPTNWSKIKIYKIYKFCDCHQQIVPKTKIIKCINFVNIKTVPKDTLLKTYEEQAMNKNYVGDFVVDKQNFLTTKTIKFINFVSVKKYHKTYHWKQLKYT